MITIFGVLEKVSRTGHDVMLIVMISLISHEINSINYILRCKHCKLCTNIEYRLRDIMTNYYKHIPQWHIFYTY